MSQKFTAALLITLIYSNTGYSNPLTPPDLAPGDRYRLVFVTSQQRDASSILSPTFDQYVSDAANSSASIVKDIDTNWRAIVSTEFIDAREHTETDPTPAGENGFPIYLVDGVTKVADSYDDLWDSTIDAAIVQTELGTTVLASVWSGSLDDGTRHPFFYLGRTPAQAGINNQTSLGRWINFGSAINELQQASVYAISDVLEVAAIPEPSGISLLVIAAGLFLASGKLNMRS